MKAFSCYILLTNETHSLIVFTSWNIGQYVYCNYLFSSHKFWTNPSAFLSSRFSTLPKCYVKNQNITRTERAFNTKYKIQSPSVAKNCLRPASGPLKTERETKVLINSCRSYWFQKFTHWKDHLLQKLFVVKNKSLIITKPPCYSLQKFRKCRKYRIFF